MKYIKPNIETIKFISENDILMSSVSATHEGYTNDDRYKGKAVDGTNDDSPF